MRPSVQIRYSMAFKRQVVEELEAGRFRSISEVSRHYGIAGSVTVRGWLRKFGKNSLLPKVVRVEKPDEADQIAKLKKELSQLRQALGQTQLQSILNESFLRIACDKLGVDVEDFKKKADTTPSTKRTSERENQ